MAAITARALACLIAGKKDDKIIRVRVKDPTGHTYFGRVGDLDMTSHNPDNASCTILADDGELVWNVLVSRIEWIDVKPRPDGH